MNCDANYAIIGAGIVGLAVALEILQRFPDSRVTVIEKEASIASHQTGRNSGVIHSGIYYKPGSLKARLCVQGATALLRFCEEHSIPFQRCGKVIVATSDREIPRLNELFERGRGNALKGLRFLSSEEIREIEPHAAGLRGIHVPGTAIVDYKCVAEKYAELITAAGGKILTSHRATALKRRGSLTSVQTDAGTLNAQLVINCAGLQSDRVRRMSDPNHDMAIVPFRGEYYQIAKEKEYLVKGLIYPVPDPQFPFLGVHFTRRIGGGVEAGPNAVLALKREGYSKTSFNLRDVADFASFPGFWKMAAQHWRMSLGEYHRSFHKGAFVRALQRLLPEISSSDLVAGGAGVRAQALNADGRLMDDFHILFGEGVVNVCNVPSPAATASLAIAQYILDVVLQAAA